uniref:C2 domain-containing protein n=1 Tax=Anopheles atroparvus TaxID=41427 RepID=A0AAG5D1S2_ANOAO
MSEYADNNLKRRSSISKDFLPATASAAQTTAEWLKKSIRRSWTISNAEDDNGATRDPDVQPYPHPHLPRKQSQSSYPSLVKHPYFNPLSMADEDDYGEEEEGDAEGMDAVGGGNRRPAALRRAMPPRQSTLPNPEGIYYGSNNNLIPQVSVSVSPKQQLSPSPQYNTATSPYQTDNEADNDTGSDHHRSPLAARYKIRRQSTLPCKPNEMPQEAGQGGGLAHGSGPKIMMMSSSPNSRTNLYSKSPERDGSDASMQQPSQRFPPFVRQSTFPSNSNDPFLLQIQTHSSPSSSSLTTQQQGQHQQQQQPRQLPTSPNRLVFNKSPDSGTESGPGASESSGTSPHQGRGAAPRSYQMSRQATLPNPEQHLKLLPTSPPKKQLSPHSIKRSPDFARQNTLPAPQQQQQQQQPLSSATPQSAPVAVPQSSATGTLGGTVDGGTAPMGGGTMNTLSVHLHGPKFMPISPRQKASFLFPQPAAPQPRPFHSQQHFPTHLSTSPSAAAAINGGGVGGGTVSGIGASHSSSTSLVSAAASKMIKVRSHSNEEYTMAAVTRAAMGMGMGPLSEGRRMLPEIPTTAGGGGGNRSPRLKTFAEAKQTMAAAATEDTMMGYEYGHGDFYDEDQQLSLGGQYREEDETREHDRAQQFAGEPFPLLPIQQQRHPFVPHPVDSSPESVGAGGYGFASRKDRLRSRRKSRDLYEPQDEPQHQQPQSVPVELPDEGVRIPAGEPVVKRKPETMRSISEEAPAAKPLKPVTRRSLSHPEKDTQLYSSKKLDTCKIPSPKPLTELHDRQYKPSSAIGGSATSPRRKNIKSFDSGTTGTRAANLTPNYHPQMGSSGEAMQATSPGCGVGTGSTSDTSGTNRTSGYGGSAMTIGNSSSVTVAGNSAVAGAVAGFQSFGQRKISAFQQILQRQRLQKRDSKSLDIVASKLMEEKYGTRGQEVDVSKSLDDGIFSESAGHQSDDNSSDEHINLTYKASERDNKTTLGEAEIQNAVEAAAVVFKKVVLQRREENKCKTSTSNLECHSSSADGFTDESATVGGYSSSETEAAGRMQPPASRSDYEEYRLVFFSSDSSSKEEEYDSSSTSSSNAVRCAKRANRYPAAGGSLDECDWDYFEPDMMPEATGGSGRKSTFFYEMLTMATMTAAATASPQRCARNDGLADSSFEAAGNTRRINPPDTAPPPSSPSPSSSSSSSAAAFCHCDCCNRRQTTQYVPIPVPVPVPVPIAAFQSWLLEQQQQLLLLHGGALGAAPASSVGEHAAIRDDLVQQLWKQFADGSVGQATVEGSTRPDTTTGTRENPKCQSCSTRTNRTPEQKLPCQTSESHDSSDNERFASSACKNVHVQPKGALLECSEGEDGGNGSGGDKGNPLVSMVGGGEGCSSREVQVQKKTASQPAPSSSSSSSSLCSVMPIGGVSDTRCSLASSNRSSSSSSNSNSNSNSNNNIGELSDAAAALLLRSLPPPHAGGEFSPLAVCVPVTVAPTSEIGTAAPVTTATATIQAKDNIDGSVAVGSSSNITAAGDDGPIIAISNVRGAGVAAATAAASKSLPARSGVGLEDTVMNERGDDGDGIELSRTERTASVSAACKIDFERSTEPPAAKVAETEKKEGGDGRGDKVNAAEDNAASDREVAMVRESLVPPVKIDPRTAVNNNMVDDPSKIAVPNDAVRLVSISARRGHRSPSDEASDDDGEGRGGGGGMSAKNRVASLSTEQQQGYLQYELLYHLAQSGGKSSSSSSETSAESSGNEGDASVGGRNDDDAPWGESEGSSYRKKPPCRKAKVGKYSFRPDRASDGSESSSPCSSVYSVSSSCGAGSAHRGDGSSDEHSSDEDFNNDDDDREEDDDRSGTTSNAEDEEEGEVERPLADGKERPLVRRQRSSKKFSAVMVVNPDMDGERDASDSSDNQSIKEGGCYYGAGAEEREQQAGGVVLKKMRSIVGGVGDAECRQWKRRKEEERQQQQQQQQTPRAKQNSSNTVAAASQPSAEESKIEALLIETGTTVQSGSGEGVEGLERTHEETQDGRPDSDEGCRTDDGKEKPPIEMRNVGGLVLQPLGEDSDAANPYLHQQVETEKGDGTLGDVVAVPTASTDGGNGSEGGGCGLTQPQPTPYALDAVHPEHNSSPEKREKHTQRRGEQPPTPSWQHADTKTNASSDGEGTSLGGTTTTAPAMVVDRGDIRSRSSSQSSSSPSSSCVDVVCGNSTAVFGSSSSSSSNSSNKYTSLVMITSPPSASDSAGNGKGSEEIGSARWATVPLVHDEAAAAAAAAVVSEQHVNVACAPSSPKLLISEQQGKQQAAALLVVGSEAITVRHTKQSPADGNHSPSTLEQCAEGPCLPGLLLQTAGENGQEHHHELTGALKLHHRGGELSVEGGGEIDDVDDGDRKSSTEEHGKNPPQLFDPHGGKIAVMGDSHRAPSPSQGHVARAAAVMDEEEKEVGERNKVSRVDRRLLDGDRYQRTIMVPSGGDMPHDDGDVTMYGDDGRLSQPVSYGEASSLGGRSHNCDDHDADDDGDDDGEQRREMARANEENVTVVTGSSTLSAVICLEDGLADDDSWVEEISQDEEEFATTTTATDSDMDDSGEEISFSQHEEELRGYNRAAIDFTLHTIVEESCEDSEIESGRGSGVAVRRRVHGRGDEHGPGDDAGADEDTRDSAHRLSASELEKYFFYGLGGDAGGNGRDGRQAGPFGTGDCYGGGGGGNMMHDDQSELSEESSSLCSEGHDSLGSGTASGSASAARLSGASMDSHDHGEDNSTDSVADLASSRLEKYFLTGFLGYNSNDRSGGGGGGGAGGGGGSDGSGGSVGSDSEGHASPEQRRKRLVRARGATRSHSSLDNLLLAGKDPEHLYHDTTTGAGTVPQSGSSSLDPGGSGSAAGSGDVDHSSETDTCDEASLLYLHQDRLESSPYDTIGKRKKKYTMKKSTEALARVDLQQHGGGGSSQATESGAVPEGGSESEDSRKTPQPPAAGPLEVPPASGAQVIASSSATLQTAALENARKQNSRDSGFIGSNDDLLKEEQHGGANAIPSTKLPSSVEPRFELEGIQEENKSELKETDSTGSATKKPPMNKTTARTTPAVGVTKSAGPGMVNLVRKDSFNNWSSDEETNLMMSKMRQFFKSLVAASANTRKLPNSSSNSTPVVSGSNTPQQGGSTPVARPRGMRAKPPQLVYFESELTRLMKTVPGIRDEQVREIVEYLSSEDTWSDSYDSSDYTSSDLEGAGAVTGADGCSNPFGLQEEISASCRQIINKFDSSVRKDEEGDIGDGGLVTAALVTAEEPLVPSQRHYHHLPVSNHHPPHHQQLQQHNTPLSKETAFVYQRLVASLSKVVPNDPPAFEQDGPEDEGKKTMVSSGTPSATPVSAGAAGTSSSSSSPPLIAKVMHHIGSRLVALMHEVSSGESYASVSPKQHRIGAGHRKSGREVIPGALGAGSLPIGGGTAGHHHHHHHHHHLHHNVISATTTEDDEDSSTSESNDRPYQHHSNHSQHHHQHHHRGQRGGQEDDEAAAGTAEGGTSSSSSYATMLLPRSKSHDLLLGDQRSQGPYQYHSGAGSGDMVGIEERGEASDYERFSWRGSFESALLANGDSRTKLSMLDNSSSSKSVLVAKRRSAGDLLFNNQNLSQEQLDRVRSCGSIGGDREDFESYQQSQPHHHQQQQPMQHHHQHYPSGSATTGRRRTLSSVAADEEDTDSDGSCKGGAGGHSGGGGNRLGLASRSTLPRSLQNTMATGTTNSLPRLPTSNLQTIMQSVASSSSIPSSTAATPISTSSSSSVGGAPVGSGSVGIGQKSQSVYHFLQNNVKSARYRAPGFNRPPSAPKRAMSAPGLQPAYPRRERRSRLQQLLNEENNSPDLTGSPGALAGDEDTQGSSPRAVGPGAGSYERAGGGDGTAPNSGGGSLHKSGGGGSMVSSPVGSAGGGSDNWPSQSDEDIDRLVALHQNRASLSSLGLRSDSMASVYSGAGEGRYGTVTVRGQIELGMQYNYKQGALEIHVKQCRDLAAVDTKRNRSDPYVKVYLLPDKSKSGKRKTKVKKHTLNPVFDEVLRFHMSLNSLQTRTIWLTVWHSDMFGRNDFLGEVMMGLQDKMFDNPQPQWYQLQERSEPFEDLSAYKGDIIIGLKYVSADSDGSGSIGPGSSAAGGIIGSGGSGGVGGGSSGGSGGSGFGTLNLRKFSTRSLTSSSSMLSGHSKGALHVLVKEAKHLQPIKSNGTCDAFCKSYLLPDKNRSSKQKTPVIKRTNSPVWNFTFVYEDVSLAELSERALELTIWDHDRLASNEFLGGVRFSLGNGKYAGRAVEWMDSTGKELSLWQNMINRPNFWVEGALVLRPSLENARFST